MSERVLIANRGEIASRIARTCNKEGYSSLAIAAHSDPSPLHIHDASEKVIIEAEPPSAPFLSVETLINTAKEHSCNLIHPGYGFLSESPLLSNACAEANITFVGPNAECLTLFGDKQSAKEHAKKNGIPILETVRLEGGTKTKSIPTKIRKKFNYPLLLKAVAGGGGRGMRLINKDEELDEAYTSAAREAEKFFGDGTIIVETYLPAIKHIEVQIACDNQGKVIHLFERECSAQRSYQKVIEEAPSCSIQQKTRKAILQSAEALFADTGYVGLATAEFLVTEDESFYFTEVNPRLQVEHTVTEEICGVDLVAIQLLLAKGESIKNIKKRFPIPKKPTGHSIQLRLYAESSTDGAPRTGEVHTFNHRELSRTFPGLRNERAVDEGSMVTHYFDPMIAKFIVHSDTRAEATSELVKILNNTRISGIETNIPLLLRTLQAEAFVDGSYITNTINELQKDFPTAHEEERLGALASLLYDLFYQKTPPSPWKERDNFRVIGEPTIKRIVTTDLNNTVSVELSPKDHQSVEVSLSHSENEHNLSGHASSVVAESSTISFTFNGESYSFQIVSAHDSYWVRSPYSVTGCTLGWPSLKGTLAGKESSALEITSPLPGTIIQLNCQSGQAVKAGETLFVLESMKMEHHITSTTDGTISDLTTDVGSVVKAGELLVRLQ